MNWDILVNVWETFLLVKFLIDVVVFVLRGLEVFGATFGFVTTILGASFHLFFLSLQTPIYDTDENNNSGNPSLQNAIGNEPLAAPMFEENPNSFYPLPISSNMFESLGNDPNVFYSSGNTPLNSIVSAHGNAPCTSRTFLNNSINVNIPNTSNNGNAPNSN